MQVNQSIAPKNGNSLSKKASFSQIIAMPSYQKMLNSAIQDPNRRVRFITTLVSAVNSTPKLKECSPDSIIVAGLQAESINLQPGLGDCYLIPYGDECKFQMGARGYVQLAMRSGAYLDIDTIEVREGEFKGRDKLTGKPIFEFIEDDDIREDLPIVGYLAYFTLLNGFHAQEYFSKTKMLNWADKYSQAFSIELYNKYLEYQRTGEGMTEYELRKCSSPWYGDTFDDMASKTVLKRLLSKRGVLSTELIAAFKNDRNDGTTDGLFEMNFADDSGKVEEDPKTVVEEEPKSVEEKAVEEPKQQAPRRGRPPKTAQQTETNPIMVQANAAPVEREFDGDF